jgi:hypothetical protein
MDLHKRSRVGLRVLWIVQGLAIAALCAGSGVASANGIVLTPHFGFVVHPGDGGSGGSSGAGQGQSQGDADITQSLVLDPAGGGQQPVPVPEPGTLALLFAGLTGLLLTRLRRRSTAIPRSAAAVGNASHL